MRHLGLRHYLAGCALIFAASSQATVYTIESTSDVAIPEPQRSGDGLDMVYEVTPESAGGACTLREAVYASNYRVAVGACEAGTENNVIRLIEGKTYVLTEGPLPIGGGKAVKFDKVESEEGEDPEPAPTCDDPYPPEEVEEGEDPATTWPTPCAEDDTLLAATISFQLALDSFEEPEGKTFPIITAEGASRLTRVNEKGALGLANLTLTGGDASTDTENPNGGLILANGVVKLAGGVTLKDGMAENGGALYLDEGATLEFLSGGRFENNEATGNGSVIATSSLFDGVIRGASFYMAGNTATDATIYLDGAEDASVGLTLRNGLVTNNAGGVIKSVAPKHSNLLSNMTIAFNGGVALHMDKSVLDEPEDPEADPPEPASTDFVLHSALVGNDAVCAGSALDGSHADFEEEAAATLAFTITDDSGCPDPIEIEEGVDVTDNPNGAETDVLLGLGREPCESSGLGACEPMPAEELDGEYPGFLPNPEPAAVTDATPRQASLFDRGGLGNASNGGCETNDYRGKTRGVAGGRCDVGAVEYQRATEEPDEIPLIQGQSVLADVLDNDRNDTQVDCNRLTAAGLDPQTDCLQVIVAPTKGSTEVVIDENGYPQVRYTPLGDYHGVDQFYYRASRHAFVGGTTVGQDPSTFANMDSAPASGLTESKSIGAQGLGILVLMIVAGLVRRTGKAIVIGFLLAMGAASQAAEIKVDALDPAQSDLAIPNDGKCTLREALENAIPSPSSNDCAFGTNGEDTIVLPAGEILLTEPLTIRGGNLIIEGKGARDDEDDDEETLTTIRGAGDHRLFQVSPPLASNGYPGVTFRYLTLEDGYAMGTDEAGSGGVVQTGGTLIFDRVILRNNRADVHGGVAYIVSNNGVEKILTFNSVWATGNSASGAGGVLAVQSIAENSPPAGDNTRVAMIDSTFDGNSAGSEGGVLDSHIVSGSVSVSNSTFFNNDSPLGSALNFSDMSVGADIMNSTFLGNGAGTGIELGEAETEVLLSNSIYFDSGADCTTGTTILQDSVYNVFSDSLCQSDNDETEATNDIGASTLLEASLSSDSGTGTVEDYVPPFLAVSSTEIDNPDLIVDAGNSEDSLASGTATPSHCRLNDLRGISRAAGEACDRGAYEYQQITAGDDEGSNDSTPDRRVAVDILDNDIPSDGAEIELLEEAEPRAFQDVLAFQRAYIDTNNDPEKVVGEGEYFVFEPEPDRPTRYVLQTADPDIETPATIDVVWRYYNENATGYDVYCGEPLPQRFIDANPDNFSDGDVAEDCVILYTPSNNGFIPDADDPGKDAVCKPSDEDEAEDWEAPRIALLYGFEDSEAESIETDDDDAGSIIMTITNKAPKITGRSFVNQPGHKIVFQVEAEDPDGNAIQWPTLAVKKEPSFVKRDSEGEIGNTGLIIDKSTGKVTYVPEGNYNTFKDTFTLTVSDDCGGTSSEATFTVTYPNEETSAGAGGVGYLIPGLLLLLLRRRAAKPGAFK